MPSGIFYPRDDLRDGAGHRYRPWRPAGGTEDLRDGGIETAGLRVSDRAHVVMPYHKLIDGLEEAARGARVQGTTKRGIGPCYTDKVARFGVRMGDLLDDDISAR